MPAPTVTVRWPFGTVNTSDSNLRPESNVTWTGGTGPFTVLHEWDTVNTFDSGALIQDSNAAATSPDIGVPPSDMGPAGTTWFYRVRVTDTSDSAFTVSATFQIVFFSARAQDRHLYLLANVGVGFDPIDTPAGGWDPEGIGGPDAGDGYALDFNRYQYLLANVGVGFDPIDTPAGGWGTGGAPGDGYALDFARFLYQLALIVTTTPTPHIWYLFPTFGREGWEFQIVGYGFGDTQATFDGSVTLNGLAVGVISWELVAQTSPNLTIDRTANIAEPIHQLIRASVPEGAESGLVVVCTDGP